MVAAGGRVLGLWQHRKRLCLTLDLPCRVFVTIVVNILTSRSLRGPHFFSSTQVFWNLSWERKHCDYVIKIERQWDSCESWASEGTTATYIERCNKVIDLESRLIASAASMKGPDKQLQSVFAQILSVDFLNGLYLSKYLLPTLKILD